MPRIINAYADGNSSIADSLAKLGESIYGDQAKNEVYRQKAFGQKNINDLAIDPSVGLDDPRLAKGQLAIGGNASGTFAGQGRALANDRWTNAATNAAGERNNVRTNAETHYGTDRRYDSDIATTGMNNATSLEVGVGNNDASRDVANINANSTRDTQLAIDSRTLQPVYDDASGKTVLVPKSQATGREIQPTKDSVVGNMLRSRIQGGQQQGAATADPFGDLSPRIQKIAGVDVPEQNLIEPRSGQTGLSRDGGVTVILPDGRKVPATGFQPVGQDAALGQARDNNVRSTVAQPLVVGDPTKSQAAADASQASGLGAKTQKFLNEDIGALPFAMPLAKGFGVGPEIAPATQRAQSQIDVRNNAARSVLLGGPGRQTVQAQKWVNDLLPQGDAFANPATEAAKVPTIINALKGDHEQIRQLAADPNTVPADRVKMVQQLRQIENTIRMFTEPAAGQAPAAAGAPAPSTPGPQTAPADPLAQARDAIARGAPRDAVMQRLQQNGVDPSGL